MGASLVSQVEPVDASAYGGLTFVLRSAVPTTVIVKLQAPYSQPSCGRCDDFTTGSECFSGYIVLVSTTTNNQPQVIRWPNLMQEAWGYRPAGTAALNPGNIISLVFAFDKGVDFDVCIDDVKLVP